MLLVTLVAVLVGAEPEPLTASVLVEVAELPAEKALAASDARLFPAGPALVVTGGAEGASVRIAGLARATLRRESAALAGAAAAYKRSLTALVSDEAPPAHGAQLVVSLTPEAGVSRVGALALLARVATVVADASRAGGVYFAAGAVAHPTDYLLRAARDRTPAAFLWVGLELGGNTAQLTLTSVGLAEAGLMELQVAARRQAIGSAIATFHELLALVTRRERDLPDGHRFERPEAAPLVVKHEGGADGRKRCRVDFPD